MKRKWICGVKFPYAYQALIARARHDYPECRIIKTKTQIALDMPVLMLLIEY